MFLISGSGGKSRQENCGMEESRREKSRQEKSNRHFRRGVEPLKFVPAGTTLSFRLMVKRKSYYVKIE